MSINTASGFFLARQGHAIGAVFCFQNLMAVLFQHGSQFVHFCW